MKAHHAKRLLKLADFLDQLPRAKFDFGVVLDEAGKPMLEALAAGRHECGTKACAIGWMPAVFPRDLQWNRGADGEAYEVAFRRGNCAIHNFEVAEEFFGIDWDESRELFDPGHSLAPGFDATPKQVARHIRKFVREKQKAAA